MPSPIKASTTNDAQREAVAIAFMDRRIRPASAVVALAARGELPGADGKPLEPFAIKADNVRTWAARLRRARMGTAKSGLTDVPARDAVESLRIRLVSAADHALTRVEKRLRARDINAKDVELARQIARLIREAAAIPAKDDPRPVPPGQKAPGADKHNGGTTVGGLAGSILASHRGGAVYTPSDEGPRQSAPTDEDVDGEQGVAHHDASTTEGTADDSPGAWMGERLGALVP